MKVTFDLTKNVANQDKHGVSLSKAQELEWDSALTWPEPRWCGIGYIGLRLYTVVFVDRAEDRRIISLRKSNRREVNRYAQA